MLVCTTKSVCVCVCLRVSLCVFSFCLFVISRTMVRAKYITQSPFGLWACVHDGEGGHKWNEAGAEQFCVSFPSSLLFYLYFHSVYSNILPRQYQFPICSPRSNHTSREFCIEIYALLCDCRSEWKFVKISPVACTLRHTKHRHTRSQNLWVQKN